MKKTLLSVLTILFTSALFAQDCQDLFFSEYVEGSSQNKALEIYNPTDHAISLEGYIIQRFSNGSSYPQYELALFQPDSGVTEIAAYDVLVVTNGQIIENDYGAIAPELYLMADLHGTGNHDNSPMYFNGNDCMTLVKSNGTALDLIGEIGVNPGIGWSDADSLNYEADADHWWMSWTSNRTLIRKKTVLHGVTSNPEFFNPALEWDTVPGYQGDPYWETQDIWDYLGSHDCDCKTSKVNEINVRGNVFIYPNPVINGDFGVHGSLIIKEVEVINAIGQVILKEENESPRGDMYMKLNNSTKGMLFVKVKFSNDTEIVKKILVK